MKTNLLKSLRLAQAYRRASESSVDREIKLAATEDAAKEDALAWKMLTAITSDELTELIRRVKPAYLITPSRDGHTFRHYIKAGGGRYASKGRWFPGAVSEADRNLFVIVKPVARILAKLGLNAAGESLHA